MGILFSAQIGLFNHLSGQGRLTTIHIAALLLSRLAIASIRRLIE